MALPTRKDTWFRIPALRSLFDDVWTDGATAGLADRLPEVFSKDFVPPLNIAETEKSVVVTLEAPGMSEDDFDIQVMGNQLMITGEKKFEEKSTEKDFHRVESQYGRFSRGITLPGKLRTDEIDAVYGKGVLTITVPKVEPTPAAKIKIRSK